MNKAMYPDIVRRFVFVIFIGAISWQSVGLFWSILGHSYTREALSLKGNALPVAKNGVLQSGALAKISGLFGRAGESSAGRDRKPDKMSAPATRLNLTLKGVVTAANPADAGAIVEDSRRKSAYYKVGSLLPGRAKLIEVYADRVILARNGRNEVLRFKQDKPRKPGGQTVNNRSRVSSVRRIESAGDFVSEAERRLGQNPAAALKTVGLRAVKSGASEGYVFNGNNPMLSKLNLKRGDVIRSVNGFPLGDIQKDRKLIRELYQQGNVSVEVERDGTYFTVNYPLR